MFDIFSFNVKPKAVQCEIKMEADLMICACVAHVLSILMNVLANNNDEIDEASSWNIF